LYRPISLLEIPYKIIAGAMANRLRYVADRIISPSQKGYMMGHCSVDITRSVQDVQDYAQIENKSLAILGLDFSKAFNSISHAGLKKILKFLNFPDKFINIIMLLLAEAQIILDINGLRGNPFKLMDGTGQGDPISSFLFNMVVQIFICKIINNKYIQHFQVDNNTIIPEMFTDDIHLFLKGNNVQTLTTVMSTVDHFNRLTGLSLSKSKTEYLGINETQAMTTKADNMGLKIVNQIKFVGAYVTKHQGSIENHLNYQNAMEKIMLVFRSWEWRFPSPIGAAVITRSLMVSTLTHLLVNFNMESDTIKEYNKLIRRFIWKGRHQVQDKRIDQPMGRGGMNITDINDFMTALRIRWYRQICNTNGLHQNWKTTLTYWLKEYNLKLTDISSMGFDDLKILGDKLMERGLSFWASTLLQLSTVAQIWEEQTDNYTMLPIFGGLIAKKANKHTKAKWLSIFNDKEPQLMQLFQQYKLVSDLYNIKTINRIDFTSPKLVNTQPLISRAANLYKNILNAVRRAYPNIIQSSPIIKETYPLTPFVTSLQYTCMKHDKGASFVYKQLINRRANIRGLMTAPAYFTWPNKINHDMTQKEWFSSLDNISQIYISPRAKWNTIQIFMRTIWTPLKNAKSYGHSSACLNCPHWEADTLHIYTSCPVARKVWSKIEKILKMLNKLDSRKSLTPQQILFHKGITDHMMIGLIIAGKYVLSLLMRKVASNPVHERVINSFTKSHLIQLCDVYVTQVKDIAIWMNLKSIVLYTFNQ
jgi:hypothetical protein